MAEELKNLTINAQAKIAFEQNTGFRRWLLNNACVKIKGSTIRDAGIAYFADGKKVGVRAMAILYTRYTEVKEGK